MPKKPAFARISITLPEPVLAAADKLAKRLDRPRSWVIAEAIRRFGTEGQLAAAPTPGPVRETITNPYAPQLREIAEANERRLKADLALTPETRVQQAEELVRLGRMVRPPRARAQIIGFESYEDYYQWKTTHRAGG
jgi:ribbon-helix-helix CopG family protein